MREETKLSSTLHRQLMLSSVNVLKLPIPFNERRSGPCNLKQLSRCRTRNGAWPSPRTKDIVRAVAQGMSFSTKVRRFGSSTGASMAKGNSPTPKPPRTRMCSRVGGKPWPLPMHRPFRSNRRSRGNMSGLKIKGSASKDSVSLSSRNSSRLGIEQEPVGCQAVR